MKLVPQYFQILNFTAPTALQTIFCTEKHMLHWFYSNPTGMNTFLTEKLVILATLSLKNTNVPIAADLLSSKGAKKINKINLKRNWITSTEKESRRHNKN